MLHPHTLNDGFGQYWCPLSCTVRRICTRASRLMPEVPSALLHVCLSALHINVRPPPSFSTELFTAAPGASGSIRFIRITRSRQITCKSLSHLRHPCAFSAASSAHDRYFSGKESALPFNGRRRCDLNTHLAVLETAVLPLNYAPTRGLFANQAPTSQFTVMLRTGTALCQSSAFIPSRTGNHHPRVINPALFHFVLVRVLDFEPAYKWLYISICKVALLAGVDGIEPPLSGPKPDALPFGYTPIREIRRAQFLLFGLTGYSHLIPRRVYPRLPVCLLQGPYTARVIGN